MATKQFIIAISREYASGGHDIAVELANRFNVDLLDHTLLDQMAEQKGFDVSRLNKYDEVPKRRLSSRTVRGFNNSPEEIIAELQFDFIRQKAEEGNSFVIVGRCAESVLADFPGLIPIFIRGDEDAKIKRIMEIREMDEKTAIATMKRHDLHRKNYHNHFCELSWGDSRAYDVCINSTALGIIGTVDYLESYIKARIEKL